MSIIFAIMMCSACRDRHSGGAAEAAGGAGGGGDQISQSTCDGVTFAFTTSLSTAIPTVATVTWSANALIDDARIDFGRDAGNLEYSAPVMDAAEQTHRTLLLGLKPSTSYSYRIVAEVRGQTCSGDFQTLATGPLRNGLPDITVRTPRPDETSGGFLVTCQSSVGPSDAGAGAWAIILDGDGDIVWWFERGGMDMCARALMSYDGQSMWTGGINNAQTDGMLARVQMDGSGEEVFDLPLRHHDFAVLPNNHLAYIEYASGAGLQGAGGGAPGILPGNFGPGPGGAPGDFPTGGPGIPPGGAPGTLPNGFGVVPGDFPDGGAGGQFPGGNPLTLFDEGCDVIRELDPETGRTELVYSVADASPSEAASCHSNAINWWPDQELYTVSVLNWNSIIAFDASGSLAWVVGGAASSYSGASWNRQHQHQLLDDGILLFNNSADDGDSRALEYAFKGTEADIVWSYESGIASSTLGSVQRLPNGNTIVSYSNNGVIHEVNQSGELVREITTGSLGYVSRRRTLYGPPPPYAE